MVLDGAGWHHGAMALPPNLKLHFLPPYSPDLAPAERLWPLIDEAVVNQTFVRRFLSDVEPLGRRLVVRGRSFAIVGVVRDSLSESFGEPPTPVVYFSYRDRPLGRGEIHVWTRPGAETLLSPAIERVVRGLDPSLVFERARPSLAQRYLKRVRYGNSTPIAAGEPVPADTAWCFEVVLDYGDHPSSASRPGGWPVRVDPFTTCHPGFEVRTYRLCRRLLVFHRFSALGDAPVLVGAIALQHDPHPEGTTLVSVGYTGHRSDMHGAREERALPSLRFEYSAPRVAAAFEGATRRATENVPHGLSGPEYRWADLYGEGIPGILAQTAHAWYFKRNEGGGIFGPMQVVARQPACSLSECTLGDFAGDGNPKLAVLHGREGGFYELDRDPPAFVD